MWSWHVKRSTELNVQACLENRDFLFLVFLDLDSWRLAMHVASRSGEPRVVSVTFASPPWAVWSVLRVIHWPLDNRNTRLVSVPLSRDVWFYTFRQRPCSSLAFEALYFSRLDSVDQPEKIENQIILKACPIICNVSHRKRVMHVLMCVHKVGGLHYHISTAYLYSPFLERGDNARIDIVLSASFSRRRTRTGGTWQADAWSDEWRRPCAHWLSAPWAARYHCRVHTAACNRRLEHLVLQVQTLGIGWYGYWRPWVRATTACLHNR